MAVADAFRESKWIWLEKSRVNQYADFIVNFAAEKGKGMVLRISADTNYAVYVNGEYVYSGQYPDYPHYKIYDELNIEQYCHAGENRLAILCYYAGEDSSTYYKAEAGLIFEIVSGGKVLAKSGENTLSREDRGYRSGKTENITPQLGRTFYYDASSDDVWKENDVPGFLQSTAAAKRCRLFLRPIPLLKLKEDTAGTIISQGEYIRGSGAKTAAENIESAFLHFKNWGGKRPLPCLNGAEMETDRHGVYFIVDMGEETAVCNAGFGSPLRCRRLGRIWGALAGYESPNKDSDAEFCFRIQGKRGKKQVLRSSSANRLPVFADTYRCALGKIIRLQGSGHELSGGRNAGTDRGRTASEDLWKRRADIKEMYA